MAAVAVQLVVAAMGLERPAEKLLAVVVSWAISRIAPMAVAPLRVLSR
jgi:hypothetical protein